LVTKSKFAKQLNYMKFLGRSQARARIEIILDCVPRGRSLKRGIRR
jgi:hypothetical protein